MSEEKTSLNDYKWNVLQVKINERKIIKSFRLLTKNKIEPILFKGWALSIYYPKVTQRVYSDIDLSVSSSSFLTAKQIIDSKEGNGLTIDLHDSFRRLDTLSWQELYKNSEIIKIDDTEIRVLRPEDHLRVVCVHWLTDGGEYREKLWDIYFLVKNRPENFDWDRCLNVVSKKRRRWIVCTIGLAHKYLGLDLKGTPIEEEAKDLPKWFVKRIEKEWKSDVRLIPLNVARNNYKLFLQQVWKRFPPNPITATIDCEGDFDAPTRILYQIKDIFKRLRKSN